MRAAQLAQTLFILPASSALPNWPTTLGALFLTLQLYGCATAPEVSPRPIATDTRPPAPTNLPPPVAAPVIPEPPPIIIHHADLHGKFENRQGQSLHIRALLLMGKTKPAPGHKGVLYYAPAETQGDSGWIELGTVEVQKPLDGDGRIQIKMMDDEKKFMIPGGKKPMPLVKNTRVKLRWEWQ